MTVVMLKEAPEATKSVPLHKIKVWSEYGDTPMESPKVHVSEEEAVVVMALTVKLLPPLCCT